MTTPTDRSVTPLVVTVLAGYALLAYAAVAPTLNLAGALLGLVLALAVLGIQVGYVSRPGVAHPRESAALALLALACLVYVPIVAIGVGWIGFAGFLAGSLRILLPPRAGLAGLGAVVVSVGLIAGLAAGAPLFSVVTSVVSTLVTGLVVHGLTRWWQQAAPSRPALVLPALPAAPGETPPTEATPAEAAAEAEPDDGSAGDGTADSGTADSTAHDGEADSTAHDGEADSTARDGEAGGAPEDGTPDRWVDALQRARSDLDAAGVDLTVLGADVELPDEIVTPFVELLRVAVAHTTRSPAATTCRVSVVRRPTEARIVVTHDGATEDPDPEDFEALGERFDDRDGSVLAERDDAEFTVDGRLPLPA